MVRAVAPWLLGRSRLFRQELLLALHCVLLVLSGFCASKLFITDYDLNLFQQHLKEYLQITSVVSGRQLASQTQRLALKRQQRSLTSSLSM